MQATLGLQVTGAPARHSQSTQRENRKPGTAHSTDARDREVETPPQGGLEGVVQSGDSAGAGLGYVLPL